MAHKNPLATVAIDMRFLHLSLARTKPPYGAIGGIGGVQLHQTRHLWRIMNSAASAENILLLGSSFASSETLLKAMPEFEARDVMRLPYPVYQLGIRPEWLRKRIGDVQQAHYRRLLRRRAALIHTHGDLWATAPAGKRKKAASYKTVVTIHTHLFAAARQAFRRTLEELSAEERQYLEALRRADRLIAVSESVRQMMMECYGFEAEKITTVYNGVDTERFKPRPRTDEERRSVAARFGLTKPYFIYFGSLSAVKNVPTIVRAFEIYRRASGIDAQLVLAGGLPQYWKRDAAPLDAQLAASPVAADIVRLPYMGADDVHLLSAYAEAFVQLSYHEGHSLGLAEAMASGVPVVASETPPVREVVGKDVPLVSPDDAEAAADLMRRFSTDTVFREATVANARRAALRFTWESSAAGLYKAYQSLL